MFIESKNPAALTRATHTLVTGARQLLDTLADVETFETVPLAPGERLGVEVSLSPLDLHPIVSLTHISADGKVRRVLANVHVEALEPSAH